MELTRTHTHTQRLRRQRPQEVSLQLTAGNAIKYCGIYTFYAHTHTRLIVGQSVTFNGNVHPPTPFGFNQFTFVNKSNTNPWWPPTPTPSPIKSHTFESHVSKLLLVSSLSRARFAPSASERAGVLSPFLSGEDRISIRMLLRSPENTRRRRQ